nr:MAG TPA: hypothetical protein [Caudoviricetes sp.]
MTERNKTINVTYSIHCSSEYASMGIVKETANAIPT